MGPWSFNVFESVLAGLPAAAVGWLARALGMQEAAATQSVVSPEVDRLWSTLIGYAGSFVLPFATLLAATLVSRGSLAKGDSSPERRSGAKVAYLYIDGAYGLWLQAITNMVFLLPWETLMQVRGLLNILGTITVIARNQRV